SAQRALLQYEIDEQYCGEKLAVAHLRTNTVVPLGRDVTCYHEHLTDAVLSPDGTLVAAILRDRDGNVPMLWRADDGSDLGLEPFAKRRDGAAPPGPRSIAFSPDSDVVAVAHDDVVTIVPVRGQGDAREAVFSSPAAVVAFGRSNELLVGTADGALRRENGAS